VEGRAGRRGLGVYRWKSAAESLHSDEGFHWPGGSLARGKEGNERGESGD
jgi:hypothetical protein